MKTAETDGTIIEFLLGSHPYDGVWFGDQHPEKEGWFWWRKALRDYASHPSPMSADDWQIIALDEDGTQHQVKHENGSAFTGNYQQCLSFYELVSGKSPMSAEQVEELGYYYPLFKFFSDEHGLSLLDSQLQDVIHECKKFIEPASPSVKADGWVSVDKEKEFHKVLKCLKNNKVMVNTREDGIYIRLAGRESEGEAFTLHFALAYPFPKLPPHQNKNK